MRETKKTYFAIGASEVIRGQDSFENGGRFAFEVAPAGVLADPTPGDRLTAAQLGLQWSPLEDDQVVTIVSLERNAAGLVVEADFDPRRAW